MNILILGAGGREHALAWKLKQSPKVDKVFIAPGNGGTDEVGTNLDIGVNDFAAIKTALIANQIALLVIGPEEPLVKGLVDALEQESHLNDLMIIGPGKEGAQLEGSKDFAKQFMIRHNIPTAKAEVFHEGNIEEGYKFLETLKPPYVLKADGLAAGKGVLITEDINEAKQNLQELIIGKQFGEASATVLIEEFLNGIELSVFILTDGENYQVLPEAKDYKRIGEGDTGPNTGGMGAVSPVIFADRIFMEKVEEKVIQPTVAGLKKDKIPYKGFVFIGLMNVENEPYVIEYNVRMGDPETEVVLPRVKSDLFELLESTAKGDLANAKIEIEPFTASTIVLVSEGYPGKYEKGKRIKTGKAFKGVIPFHAGTKRQSDEVVTNGGRVMAITGLGKNLGEAVNKSYEVIKSIEWEGMTFRKDIGSDLVRLGQ
ncbi:MAG: phosphoribosylamine--glycine ligase [Cyclobacteriaceae bacterium]|nr:phosphoribosylamine--glycine ligase [Cyclobacteriaceae bacterium HetDA_MAG_MS6]